MAKPAASIRILGVRHHGPGSARSVRDALTAYKPDCLLIEGPPDADEALALAGHEQMQPPVALLGYVPDEPQRAVYFPFAEFSPEWQALRFGLERKIPVRFMDLPLSNQMALDAERRKELEAELKARLAEAPGETPEDAPACGEPPALAAPDLDLHPRHDPLRWLAEAAGYNDGERWWEHMVEERADSTHLFQAVQEAMTALRKELPPLDDAYEASREALREAHMRQTIRAAQEEGFARIAAVCGAWHAPALLPEHQPPAPADAALLKGLPREKVVTTWVPWTYERLAAESGYGAGVQSPGWYEHLWRAHHGGLGRVTERWLTRVARLLRAEDLDASSAQTIDAVRLGEALAAMRGRPRPGLAELNEACRACFCFGADVPLLLIRRKLIVGEALGRVPDETPMVPLQQDVQREQKRLRFPPAASAESIELDLRKPTDLGRSLLLHRLRLLGIAWGEPVGARGKGTFKEAWRVAWKPEFAVDLILASRWGNTVAEAASVRALRTAEEAAALPELTELIGKVLLSDLPDAAAQVMRRLQHLAAVASDVGHLMDSLPPMAEVLRYGSVRKTDESLVRGVVDGLVARVCVGLPVACGSFNDEAAGEMFRRIVRVHPTIQLLQQREHLEAWLGVLTRLADLPNLHGLVAGRSVRLLLETGKLDGAQVAQRVSLALSRAVDAAQAAAWIEGFVRDSGQILIHDERLWGILDDWVRTLAPDAFIATLPLLRRTFGTFSAPERRQMGERVRHKTGGAARASVTAAQEHFDAARAEAALPLLRQLLGLHEERRP